MVDKEVFGWLDLKVDDSVKEENKSCVLLGNCTYEMVSEVLEKGKVLTNKMRKNFQYKKKTC